MGYSGPLNDIPSGDQKDALVGTSGTPSTSNKFVTDEDSRNDDDRTPVVHTEAKHSAAATQTISADDFTIVHNDKSVVIISLEGCLDIHISSATTAIADGSVVGQQLVILLATTGSSNVIKIRDSANTKLRGDWYTAKVESRLGLIWDGSDWVEIGRLEGSNTPTGLFAVGLGRDNSPSGEAAVGIGQNNSPTGEYAVGIGHNNSPTGNYAVGLGQSNFPSGNHTVGLGQSNSPSGEAAIGLGAYSSAPLYGQVSHASGRFSAAGDAQSINLISRKVITHSDSLWSDLSLDGNDDLILIPTDSVWNFEILIVGTTQGCTKSFGFKIVGVVENDGGTLTILASTVTTIYDTDDTDFDAQVECDELDEALFIQVRDSTSGGDVVRWVAHTKAVCVSFPA